MPVSAPDGLTGPPVHPPRGRFRGRFRGASGHQIGCNDLKTIAGANHLKPIAGDGPEPVTVRDGLGIQPLAEGIQRSSPARCRLRIED